MGLWVMAGSWCADNLTDGWLPDYIAMRLDRDYEENAKTLVQVGLWVEEIRDSEPGWRFHEWNEPGRQPTKEHVLAERAAAADRQKRARDRAKSRREHGSRSESQDDSHDRHGVSHAVTDAVTHGDVTGVVTVPPTRPDPTRPNTTTPSGVAGADEAARPAEGQQALAGMPAGETPPPPKQKRRTAKKEPPPPGDGFETEGQRINRVTRIYTDRVRLSNFMGAQGVVRTALRSGAYTEEQVIDGLNKLADNEDPLTNNSLRTAIKPPSWASNDQPRSSAREGLGSTRHRVQDSHANVERYKENI